MFVRDMKTYTLMREWVNRNAKHRGEFESWDEVLIEMRERICETHGVSEEKFWAYLRE